MQRRSLMTVPLAMLLSVSCGINAGGQVCAYRDGLELAVNSSNDFSEQYKFWVTSGHLRLGDNAYRATCTPAWS